MLWTSAKNAWRAYGWAPSRNRKVARSMSRAARPRSLSGQTACGTFSLSGICVK